MYFTTWSPYICFLGYMLSLMFKDISAFHFISLKENVHGENTKQSWLWSSSSRIFIVSPVSWMNVQYYYLLFGQDHTKYGT